MEYGASSTALAPADSSNEPSDTRFAVNRYADLLAEKEAPTDTAARTSIVSTHNLGVWFGKNKVLENINLTFPEHSITALIGPSGCGKSTFLRTLNRLHELIPKAALAGSVTYQGKDIYDAEIDPVWVRQQIGMVFQKPNPFPSMTIRTNVLSGLRLTGRKHENPDELVEDVLTQAGLWNEVKDRLHQNAASLSGGQQQRLIIARALAVNPSVLLLDEPCSALDPGSTLKIEETMRQLAKKKTLIIVTHNMQQAIRISDYSAFFLAQTGQPGQLIEHNSTTALFGNPADSRTLDYIIGRFG